MRTPCSDLAAYQGRGRIRIQEQPNERLLLTEPACGVGRVAPHLRRRPAAEPRVALTWKPPGAARNSSADPGAFNTPASLRRSSSAPYPEPAAFCSGPLWGKLQRNGAFIDDLERAPGCRELPYGVSR